MIDVSRETAERLEIYAELLRRWSKSINLVAPRTIKTLWDRHIIDSLQLAPFAQDGSRWCDIGSGGGLPGMIVAIARPDVACTLIESDSRKCVFLRTVVRDLSLSAEILNHRIESATPASAQTVSARALAPLHQLIPLALRHGRQDSQYIFPKGERFQNELARARRTYRFDVDARPSITDKNAVVLILRNIQGV